LGLQDGVNIYKKVIALILVMCVLSSIFVIAIGRSKNRSNTTIPNTVNYTPEDPIRIDSDEDFTSENGVISGNGTEENPYIIEGYSINGEGERYGIFIGNTSSHFVIKDCFIYGVWYDDYVWPYFSNSGITLYNVSNGTIDKNIINSCYHFGSHVDEGSGGQGIYLIDSHENKLTNNSLEDNSNAGIALYNSNENTIISNTAEKNENGIYMYECENNFVSRNFVSENSYSGIGNDNTYGTKIEYNEAGSNSGFNIFVYESSNVEMISNEVYSDDTGILGQHISNSVLSNNTAIDNDRGIVLYEGCVDNIVNNNSLVNNNRGLYIYDSEDNTIINSHITGGEFGLYLEDSNKNILDGLSVEDNSKGIKLEGSEENRIYNNSIYDNVRGLDFCNSDFNIIENNSLEEQITVEMFFSNHNEFRYNSITDSYSNFELEESNSNIIKGNNISNTIESFLKLDRSDNNIILENNIDTTQREPVIIFLSSNNNRIYHNNFINISEEPVDDLTNFWDNGYPDGGNYWEFLEVDDFYSGPEQDIKGSDGIIDQPYHIPDGDNKDNYPLSHPYIWWKEVAPSIEIISPTDYNVFNSSDDLRFDIWDGNRNLEQTNYTIDGVNTLDFETDYKIDLSEWNEGEYEITIEAVDSTNLITKKTYNVTIDDTKPEIVLNEPSNTSIINKSSEIQVEIIDQNFYKGQYKVNNGENISVDDSFTIDTSNWNEGENEVCVTAVDKAGNANHTDFFFTLDDTKPTIYLNDIENGSVIQSGFELGFTIEDDHLDSVKYSVNEGRVEKLQEPYLIESDGWEEGYNRIHIIAEDKAGNKNEEFFEFEVDNTAPDIQLISPETNTFISGETIINFDISDKNLEKVHVSVNEGSQKILHEPYEITGLEGNGNISVEITAVDFADNVNISTYDFILDNKNPELRLVDPIDYWTNEETITVNWETQDKLSGINHSELKIIDRDTVIIKDNWTISINLEEGLNRFELISIDNVGNKASIDFQIYLDTNKPLIDVSISEKDISIENSTVMVPLNVSDDFSGIRNIEVKLNENEWINVTGKSSYMFEDIAEGEHTVFVKTIDQAGNENIKNTSFTMESQEVSIWEKIPTFLVISLLVISIAIVLILLNASKERDELFFEENQERRHK